MALRRLIPWTFGGGLALAGALGAAPEQALAAPLATEVVQVSPREQEESAEAILARMDNAAGAVRKQLEEARRKNDVVKTLCLDDKLTQIDVTAKSAKNRATEVKEAAALQNVELASHHFTILVVLRDRVEQVVVEANRCLGAEAGVVGESSVTTDVDPSIPIVDATDYPDAPVIALPPVCASCYK